MKPDSSTISWNNAGLDWYFYAQTNDYRRHFIMPYTLQKLGDVDSMRIIDVGCGEGGYSRELARRGAHLTAVDCSALAIEYAVNEARQENLNIRYLVRNSNDLFDVGAGEYDIVLASMMLMDCEDLDGTIEEIKRVLKPDGKVFISILHPCFNGKNVKWTKDVNGTLEVRIQNYFLPKTWEGKITHAPQPTVIWRHRTLEEYFDTFFKHNLYLRDLNEPIPTAEQIRKSPDMVGSLAKIPMFLFCELRNGQLK